MKSGFSGKNFTFEAIYLFTLKRYLTSFPFYRIFGLLLLLLTASALSALAQRTCGTPLAIKQAITRNPKLLERYQKIRQEPSLTIQDQSIARGRPVAVIPVVVHVVLPNPESVTDAQVMSQIAVLNEDYAQLNTDTAQIPDVWQPVAGDMKISFCLAQRTPDGAPTNGIDRVKTNRRSFNVSYAAADVKHSASGGADAWNTTDYLNIWVCNLAGDNLGVGTPPVVYPEDEQGVVIQYNAFGTVGNLLPDFNKGRTCTHELGHFFNLLHLWGAGDGSCTPGDHVEDTPPQSAPVYGDPSFPDLNDPCSPNFPGIMINNFMGYANDAVMNMFTKDQVVRAQTNLFSTRSSLLSSDGCKPVQLKDVDAKLRSVAAPSGKLCTDRITPVVTLQNFGNQDLTSATLEYMVDGAVAKTFQWTGQLQTLDSIQVALPISSVAIGMHRFRVYVSAPNGQTDAQTANDTLTATFHFDPEATVPFSESFEESRYPPSGWTISNPDHQFTWERTSQAAHSGNYAVMVKNLDYQANGPVDELVSPVFDVQNADSAFLFFDVAAAVQSDPGGNNAYWDTLEVLISYDCGQSGTTVYKKWGSRLITVGTPVTAEFVPSSEEWRRDSINLTPYVGKGQFRIIFRNITNFENNIYLDDIKVITRPVNPILKREKVIVVPNPVSGILHVQFLSPPPDLQAVSIYNAAGQLVMQKAASAINSANRIMFDLTEVPSGVYFVKLSYKDRDTVRKIIKMDGHF